MATQYPKRNGIAHLNILNVFNALLTLVFYFLISRYSQPSYLNSITLFFVSYSIYSVVTAFSLNISTLSRISQSTNSEREEPLDYVVKAVEITTWTSLIPSLFLSLVGYIYFRDISSLAPLIFGILSGAVSNYSRIFLAYKYSTMSRGGSLLAFFLVFPLPRVISLILFFYLHIYYGIEIGFLLGYLISVLVLFPKRLHRLPVKHIEGLFSRTFPLYILSLIGLGQEWLGTISIMVISKGDFLIGRYYVLNALNIFLVSVCAQIFLGLYPVLAKKGMLDSKKGDNVLGKKTDQILSLIILSFVMFVSAESPVISKVLFGTSNLFLDVTLVILSISTYFASFGGFYVNSYGFDTYYLIFRQKWRTIYIVGGITLFSFVVSMFILTAIFGLIGIPIAFLIMNIISFVLVRFNVLEQGKKYNPVTPRLILYSAIIFIAVWIFNSEITFLPILYDVILAVLVFIGSSIAALIAIKPVRLKDLRFFYDLLTT